MDVPFRPFNQRVTRVQMQPQSFAEVPMLKYLFVASSLSLFVSSVAMAQHGGTQQERRACGGNVHRYCRPMLDQGDFAVLTALVNRHLARKAEHDNPPTGQFLDVDNVRLHTWNAAPAEPLAFCTATAA
jgi:hypothetical protein